MPTSTSRSAILSGEATSNENIPESEFIEPLFGLEEIRKKVVRCSKSAFYGPGGLARELPTIEISARRRAVRLSDLNAVLAKRTRRPEASRHDSSDG